MKEKKNSQNNTLKNEKMFVYFIILTYFSLINIKHDILFVFIRLIFLKLNKQ